MITGIPEVMDTRTTMDKEAIETFLTPLHLASTSIKRIEAPRGMTIKDPKREDLVNRGRMESTDSSSNSSTNSRLTNQGINSMEDTELLPLSNCLQFLNHKHLAVEASH